VVLAAAGVLAALFAWWLYRSQKPEADPSQRGPKRWVQVDRVELVEGELSLSGRTNLIDGAKLRIEVGDRLFVMTCQTSQLGWAARSAVMAVERGRYPVLVRFRLEDQTAAVKEALHFQPRMLEARGTLEVAQTWPSEKAGAKRDERLRRLFEAVNRAPRVPEEIDRLDAELARFAEGAGVGRKREAARSLRFALEVLRRRSFEREEFEGHVLKAHVAAGL
tara:strand:- start:359 stop:1021 length:663 start_codon:yes stop_codon:yes gene_type:complete